MWANKQRFLHTVKMGSILFHFHQTNQSPNSPKSTVAGYCIHRKSFNIFFKICFKKLFFWFFCQLLRIWGNSNDFCVVLQDTDLCRIQLSSAIVVTIVVLSKLFIALLIASILFWTKQDSFLLENSQRNELGIKSCIVFYLFIERNINKCSVLFSFYMDCK